MKQKYVMKYTIRTQEPKAVTRERYHKGHYWMQSETQATIAEHFAKQMLTESGTNINVQIMEVGETYRLMTIGGNGAKTIMILSDKVIFAGILVLLVAAITYMISVLR